MSGNFTVLNDYEADRFKKLETFYYKIQQLAVSANLNQFLLIYQALSEVNPNWNEEQIRLDIGSISLYNIKLMG